MNMAYERKSLKTAQNKSVNVKKAKELGMKRPDDFYLLTHETTYFLEAFCLGSVHCISSCLIKHPRHIWKYSLSIHS